MFWNKKTHYHANHFKKAKQVHSETDFSMSSSLVLCCSSCLYSKLCKIIFVVWLFIYTCSLLSMDTDMNKWYKCACLSFCLSVCPSGRLRLNKQLCLWSKEEATRVFCLLPHFTTHRHILIHTATHPCECPARLIFYLSRFVAFLTPCFFCPTQSLPLPPLLGVKLVRSQTKRNAAPCDLSPTARRGAGLDEGARGQLQSCAQACKETHTHAHKARLLVKTHTLWFLQFYMPWRSSECAALLQSVLYVITSGSVGCWALVCVCLWTHEWSAA